MRFINCTLLLLLLLLQVRLWVGENSIGHIVSLNQKIESQTGINRKLQTRNNLLAAEVVDLQNGYATIEAYARSELGMIKPNETFFLVIPEKE
jgi:cell division protein FtsB